MLKKWLRKPWFRNFLIALASILALALLAQFFDLTKEECEHARHAWETDCPRYNLVLALLWDGLKIINDASVFLTAAATVGLVLVTYLLVKLGQDQSVTSKTQLRAYVFAVDMKQYWEKNGAGDYVWRFRPIWKNSGSTPTRALLVRTECIISNVAMPANFDFNIPTLGGSGLIAPGQSSEGGLAPEPPNPPVTPQDILDVQAGTKFVYLFGWIRYHDVFPQTKQHITRFCWSLVFTGDPKTFIPGDPNHPLRIDWIHQSRGNCSDDECVIDGMG